MKKSQKKPGKLLLSTEKVRDLQLDSVSGGWDEYYSYVKGTIGDSNSASVRLQSK